MTEQNKEEGSWDEIKGGTIHRFEENNMSIEGVLKNKQKGRYEHDDYVIEKEDGNTEVVFGGTVLNTKMVTVEIGDRVRITSLGKAKSEKGMEYNDFKVEVQKEDPTATTASLTEPTGNV